LPRQCPSFQFPCEQAAKILTVIHARETEKIVAREATLSPPDRNHQVCDHQGKTNPDWGGGRGRRTGSPPRPAFRPSGAIHKSSAESADGGHEAAKPIFRLIWERGRMRRQNWRRLLGQEAGGKVWFRGVMLQRTRNRGPGQMGRSWAEICNLSLSFGCGAVSPDPAVVAPNGLPSNTRLILPWKQRPVLNREKGPAHGQRNPDTPKAEFCLFFKTSFYEDDSQRSNPRVPSEPAAAASTANEPSPPAYIHGTGPPRKSREIRPHAAGESRASCRVGAKKEIGPSRAKGPGPAIVPQPNAPAILFFHAKQQVRRNQVIIRKPVHPAKTS